MNKNLFLPLCFSLVLGAINARAATPKAQTRAVENAAVHGMVVFGKDTLFVSHIPMFMLPHDKQALMQVKLSHPQSDALAVYQKTALSATGAQALITVRPKPFILTSLLSGKITSFTADLYKGNFENNGKLLLANVTVNVDKILYLTQLSKTSKASEQLTYIPVESQGQSYLVHQITAPKNFDHIVQVQWLNGSSAGSSALRSFPLSDKEANRLKAGQYFTVNSDGTTIESKGAADASFKVVADFYCTQGPDFYNLCN